MRLIPRIAVLVLAAAVVAVAAGCGGGKSSPAAATTETTSGGATTQQQTTTGSTPSGFASAKNCAEFSGLAAKIASAAGATSGNPATELDNAAKQMQALVDAAPSDIRPDFQTIATAFGDYVHALQQAGFKPGASASTLTPAQISALVTAAKSLDSTKLTQAEQHISRWAAQNCQ